MDDFDLEAACLVRLRQDLEALLANVEPACRERIIALFSIRPRDGLEAIPQLRAVLGPRLRRWPWPAPAGENGTGPVGDAEWEVEALPEQPRATLWPYRPKREPDELISSWLWRIARGLGAPPKRFVLDAIGSRLTDVDREISDTAIDRLAFLSGQSRGHLMGGTMRADIEVRPGSRREQVQRALLRHGDLVLNRHHGGRGRAVPIVQYCPVCLAAERTAYLRRGWRFSIEVACVEDGCFLLDACWKCGALLNPLAQAVPATAFVCVKCCAPLAKAPSLRMREAVGEQTAIYEELHRLAFTFADDFVGSLALDYVERLSSGDLRGTNPDNAAHRHNAVMLEAWRLRERGANGPGMRMRPTRRRTATARRSGATARR
jgi:hypothetical protein